MTKRMQMVAGVTLLLGSDGLALGVGKESGPSVPFAVASVRFEQNATDGDAEVMFEVKGGKEGLAKLAVVSPDGRTVIDFMAPDASTLGIRRFRFETPEPGDVKSLKSAYPEGVYTFAGAYRSRRQNPRQVHAESQVAGHGLLSSAQGWRPGRGRQESENHLDPRQESGCLHYRNRTA